jgi:sugar/nucleoside kinase (ribokinase family)
VLAFALLVEDLEMARSALECGKPAWPSAATLGSPPTVHRRERSRCTHDASEHERAKSLSTFLAVHASDLTIHLTMLICCLGDLTLDVVVQLSGPIAVGGDTDAEIVLAPGGQAANVAAWAASLGASARFVGRTGDDDAGSIARGRLREHGVDIVGPFEGANGLVCSLVSPDGARSMAADRGTAVALRPDDLDPAWFEGCDHLFVSGYALMREPARSAAVRAVEHARAEHAHVGVDLASWSGIRDSGTDAFRDLVIQLEPDVVFANEDEERIVRGPLAGVAWILKRGARGCSFDGDEREALPVTRVVDSTGAGDALAAGWIVGGPDLALAAAARCIQQLGAMP